METYNNICNQAGTSSVNEFDKLTNRSYLITNMIWIEINYFQILIFHTLKFM